MSAVFDASVVVKWFVDDPLTSAAREARLAFRPAVAPGLLLVETAKALRRYVVGGELEPAAAQDDLSLIPTAVELSDHNQGARVYAWIDAQEGRRSVRRNEFE